MKPRESTIQAKGFEAAALRRQLVQFDRMIGDLKVIHVELGKQIAEEERRTGNDDPANFAYSTVAKAARERRTNLAATISDLEERRTRVVEALSEIDGFFMALSNAAECVFEVDVARAHHVAA